MAKTSVAQMPEKLYELLEPLAPEDRARVVQATFILFGEAVPAVGGVPKTPMIQIRNPSTSDAGTYFDAKGPKNKGEELAVAARFREINEGQETHSKADLKKVVTDARRNFDDSNFNRDINNAKRQAGFFNLGTGRDGNKLSYFGQGFVDALPDRDAIAKLKKPKVGGNRKKAAKKKVKS